MEIKTYMFWTVYGLFLLISIPVVILNYNLVIVNKIVLGISVASLLFSVAELFYSISNIKREERIRNLIMLYKIDLEAEKLKEKLIKKYGQEVEENINIQDMDIIKDYNCSEDNLEQTYNLVKNPTEKEKILKLFGDICIIIGLLSLVCILAFYSRDYKYTAIINNAFTVIAFLAIIVSYILKDIFRQKATQELDEFNKEINDIKL